MAVATIAPLVLAPLLAPGAGARTNEVLGFLLVVAYAGHLPVTGWLWTLSDVRATGAQALPPCRRAGNARRGGRGGGPGAFPATSRMVALGLLRMAVHPLPATEPRSCRPHRGKWHAPSPTEFERRLIAAAGWCGTAGLIARPGLLAWPASTPPGGDDGRRQAGGVRLSDLRGAAALTTVAVSDRPAPVTCAQRRAVHAAGLLVHGSRRGRRRHGHRPRPAALVGGRMAMPSSASS